MPALVPEDDVFHWLPRPLISWMILRKEPPGPLRLAPLHLLGAAGSETGDSLVQSVLHMALESQGLEV